MAVGNSCIQERPSSVGIGTSETNINDSNSSILYKEPVEGKSQFYGMESYFNEEVTFYKDVRIYGEIKSNFNFLKNISLEAKTLQVSGISVFDNYAYFGENVYVSGNVNAGIVTARQKLQVGCGGTVLVADVLTQSVGIGSTIPTNTLDVNGNVYVNGNVGIGSTIPQQRVDVAGSVKIDATIFDSINAPGRNGYYMVRDQRGLRWIPEIAEPVSSAVSGLGLTGISTSEGVFVLNQGVPLYV